MSEPDIDSNNNSGNTMVIGLIVVALLAVATTGFVVVSQNGNTGEIASTQANGKFKDGSYTANGSYQTPGGIESIDLTVTISNNVIKDSSIKQNAISAEAHQYQAFFASGYKAEIVGKRIDSVSLSRVSGSSLTSSGFNKAIDDIENQARV